MVKLLFKFSHSALQCIAITARLSDSITGNVDGPEPWFKVTCKSIKPHIQKSLNIQTTSY